MIKISELLLNFIINASWQIAAIALMATAFARLLNNAPARYRHLLWVGALLLSVALPVWSISGTKTEESPHQMANRIAEQAIGRGVSEDSLVKPNTTRPVPTTGATGRPASAGYLFQNRIQQLSTGPTLVVVLSFGYLLFVLYRLGRLWRFWRRTEALKGSIYHKQISASMEAVATRCRSAFGLEEVPVMCTTMTSTPGVVGGRQPVIILPESFFGELPCETLYSILGHEMAHIARRDFQLNLVYEFLWLPISFHPLASVLKQQIERTRELACDEMVTERLLEPVAHARSLLRIAGALITPSDQALTLGIFDANILEERIMKLTRKTRPLGSRAGRLLTLTAVSLLCFSSLAISTFSFELRAEQGGLAASARVGNELATRASLDLSLENQTPTTPQNQNRPASESGTAAAEQLKSTEAHQVALGACDAGKRGAIEMIPQLISMLGDDRKTELIMCWTSGRWSPALSSFKHPSPGEQAAIALASMGTPAFEPLTNALQSSDAVVRRNAAWAIGELTNMATSERTDAVAPLVSLLNDSDQWVRMASARALGELRDERSGERLVAALDDSAAGVRQISAWALGEMKDQRAVEALSRVVVSDAQTEVRLTAAEALGEIANSKAISALTQALSDSDASVRAKATWALAEIADEEG